VETQALGERLGFTRPGPWIALHHVPPHFAVSGLRFESPMPAKEQTLRDFDADVLGGILAAQPRGLAVPKLDILPRHPMLDSRNEQYAPARVDRHPHSLREYAARHLDVVFIRLPLILVALYFLFAPH
jgi:hypothetical protein